MIKIEEKTYSKFQYSVFFNNEKKESFFEIKYEFVNRNKNFLESTIRCETIRQIHEVLMTLQQYFS